MTDYVTRTEYTDAMRARAMLPRHLLTAGDMQLATFYGPVGAALLGVLCGAIAEADIDSEHTITNGDTGQMTYGRLGDLLKD